MKNKKIIYWSATGLFAVLIALTSYGYLAKLPKMMASFKELGMPYPFFFMLGIAKILGIMALLFSKWETLKEWAYAGFAFTMLGAIWMHCSVHSSFLAALACLLLLAVSYVYWRRLDRIAIFK